MCGSRLPSGIVHREIAEAQLLVKRVRESKPLPKEKAMRNIPPGGTCETLVIDGNLIGMGRTLAKAVALLALITVISGAQCLNFCAVHPCDEVQTESRPVEATESCHHSPASSKPQPPERRPNCAHQPMLVSTKDTLFTVPGATVLTALPILLVHSVPVAPYVAVLSGDTASSPPTRSLTKTLILRI